MKVSDSKARSVS